MAFWTEIWTAAMQVKDSFLGLLKSIGEVLIDWIYSIGREIFKIVQHLFDWIDEFASKYNLKGGKVIMVPPKDTEEFLTSLKDRGKTTLPAYTPGTKRTLIVANDANGKIKVAQVGESGGYENTIQDSFDKGALVEQPIS